MQAHDPCRLARACSCLERHGCQCGCQGQGQYLIAPQSNSPGKNVGCDTNCRTRQVPHQSMVPRPMLARKSLALLNGREPKKPECAESGLGCGLASTR